MPHTGEQSDQEQQFIGVPLNRLQEPGDFFLFQGRDFFLIHLRQVTGIGGIVANRTNFNSLIQSLVKRPMNIFNGLCGPFSRCSLL